MKQITFALSLFVVSFAQVGQLHAQNIAWDGGGDGLNWFDSLNWDLNIVPTKTHDVIIDIPANMKIESLVDTAFANSIEIDGSSVKLSLVDGLLILESTNSTPYCVLVKGGSTFNASGRMLIKRCLSDGMRIEDGSFSVAENDTLRILGVANNANGQGIDIEQFGFVQNDGYLSIRGAGMNNFEDGIVCDDGGFNTTSSGVTEIFNIEGNINSHGIEINNGTLTNSGIITIDTIENGSGIIVTDASGQFRNFSGTVNVDHILNSARSGVVVSGGALFTGYGTINSDKVIALNPGTRLSPGPVTRKLTINGDLTLGSEPTLVIEIAGDNGAGVIGGHDLLEINGDIILDNNDDILDVNLVGGYMPQFYEQFKFIEFTGSFTGTFPDIDILHPPGYSDWIVNQSWNSYMYQLGCLAILNETCMDASCTIPTSTVEAASSMNISGPYQITGSADVIFSAPVVELGSEFSVEAGATLVINQAGCIPD